MSGKLVIAFPIWAGMALGQAAWAQPVDVPVTNGSFEAPAVAGDEWAMTPQGWVTNGEGSHILSDVPASRAPGGGNQYLWVYNGAWTGQTGATFQAGHTYTLSAQVNADTSGYGWLRLMTSDTANGASDGNPLSIGFDSGNYRGDVDLDGNVWLAGTGWNTLTKSFTVHSGDAVAGKYIVPQLESTNWSIFDNITITDSDIPLARAAFAKQWLRERPLSVMAAVYDVTPGGYAATPFDVNKYLGMNLNMVFANNNDVIATTAADAGVPWQMGYPGSGEPYPPYYQSPYQVDLINQLTARGGINAWMLPDEPTEAEFQNVALSAQWMRENHPDLLMMDAYPFGGSSDSEWFKYVMDVRQVCLSNQIPYGGWLQSFHVQDYNLRTPSESDTRYNGFTLLTAGYTMLNYYVYDEGPDSPVKGTFLDNYGNPTAMYAYAASANAEYIKVGQSLRFLTSADVRFVAGRHTVIGNITAENSTPNGLSKWAAGAGADSHILSVSVGSGQIGSAKNGLLGLFTDDDGEHYFMLTNLNHGGGLSAATTGLSFVMTFASDVDVIYRLSRITGAPERVNLSDHILNVTLPGGTGDLFKYDDGYFAGITPGDADVDGDVDLSDLGRLATSYGVGSGGTWLSGDFDLDGDVDLADLGVLASHYGAGSAQAFADFQVLQGVPEPMAIVSTIALCKLALILHGRRIRGLGR